MKRLLVLNGSFSEATLIEKAKELGYYVITSGNNPSLIGHAFADEYIGCDYSDKESILELVKKNKIDRIVSCANDFGVITASYVAEKLSLPGHDTYKNAVLLHRKDLFKAFIQKLGIRTPYPQFLDVKEVRPYYAKDLFTNGIIGINVWNKIYLADVLKDAIKKWISLFILLRICFLTRVVLQANI